MSEFSRKDLAGVFPHIPPPTIRKWLEADLFQASQEDSNGRGVVRIYDVWNLYQIGMLSELALMFSLKECKDIMHKHFWGKDNVLKRMKECFGISISYGRIGWPVYKHIFRPATELHEFIDVLMAPTNIKQATFVHIPGGDVIPSRIIIINCHEVADKVDSFVKNANVV